MLLGQRVDREHFRLYRPEEYGFLKPKAHGRILAITFTNKATQEMTVRIIKELSLLANPGTGKSPYLRELMKLFAATEEELAASARRALADLLFNYSWFNVSTIDSFFQNVLHIFTRELDLPESFSLEISDIYPIAAAVGQMLSSINIPPRSQDKEGAAHIRRLKNWLQSYMETLLDNGTDSNLLARTSRLNSYLIGTISSLRGETFKANSKQILDYLADPDRPGRFVRSLADAQRRLRDQVRAAAESFLGLEEAALLPKLLKEDYLQRWAAGDFSYTSLGRDTLPKAILPDGKRHTAPKKGIQWSDAVDSLLLRILEAGMKYFVNERFYSLLRRQTYLLGLFSEACRHIDEYCRENEAFLLGDTNSLLRKVICEEEAPFVYERIGYTINHFLIDEFQDTSEMQWANLSPLLMESMARGKDNLIIGDEKQCIYRFRNSNPELLGHKVEDAAAERFGADDVTIRGTAIEDNTNWRSAPEIVKFNNSLFKVLAEIVDGSIGNSSVARQTYGGIIQQVAEKNRTLPGYVKVLVGPDAPSRKTQQSVPDGEPLPVPPAPWTQEDILRRLALEIDRQLTAGYSPADIAVLVYTHDQGEATIAYLLDYMASPEWKHGHIDIMSSDALEISASPAVQLIVGMLRLMTTPQYILDKNNPGENGNNMIPNPEFLRNRLIHRFELSVFDQTELLDSDGEPVLDEEGNPLMRRLSPREALRKAILATTPLPGEENPDPLQAQLDNETAKIGEMDCPSLFAVTERIIRNYLPAESRRNEAASISAFQDLVMEFTERGESDAEAFLKWWDSRGKYQTLPAPDGMQAITVMTIHQSKGLEYDCVHIPFTSKALARYTGEDWYRLDVNGFPGADPEDVPPFIPLQHSQSYTDIPMLASQIELYTLQQKIDSLNVAYVAFTRAVRELTVYVTPAAVGETLGKLLLESFSRLDSTSLDAFGLSGDELEWVVPLRPLVNEVPGGERLLEYGSPTFPVRGSGEPQESAAAQETGTWSEGGASPSLTSFDAEIPYGSILEEYLTVRPAEMILPVDVEQQGVFDITDERHVGNFLHDALATVRKIEDLPLAVERAAYARCLSREQWGPYLRKLESALNNPQVLPWFRDFTRLMTERPLTTSDGLRRPDRIVWMPDDTIVVIDYKFGQPRRKYRDQVRDYMGLLSQCGLTGLRGYLFFPLADDPRNLVIPVD